MGMYDASVDWSPQAQLREKLKRGFSPYAFEQAQAPMAALADPRTNASANQQQVSLQMDPHGSLPQVPKGSGLTNSEQESEEDKRKRIARELVEQTPEQLQTTYSSFENLPLFDGSRRGLGEQEALIQRAAARPPSIDMRPLASLVDAWTGSNFQAGTSAPETLAQRDKQILEYSQKLQQDKGDLSKRIIEAASKRKTGLLETILENNTANIAKQMAQDPNQMMRGNPATQVMQFARQTDKESKDFRMRGELLDSAARLLNGTPAAQNSLPALAARIIEGTVRPQLAVIAREGGDPSWWARAEAVFTRIAEGSISPENVRQYSDLIRQLHEQHAKDVAGAQKRWHVMGDRLGLSPNEYSDMTGPHWSDPHKSSTDTLLKKHPLDGGGAKSDDSRSSATGGTVSAPAKTVAPAGKIKVTNGKETLLINSADLEHAKKDGFKAVK